MKTLEFILCFENKCHGKIIVKPTIEIPEQLANNITEILNDETHQLTFVEMIEITKK
jgi:hypothetical protein